MRFGSGENHPNCKLKDYQVEGLRKMPKEFRPTQKRLAEIYGVSQQTIYRVLAKSARFPNVVSY